MSREPVLLFQCFLDGVVVKCRRSHARADSSVTRTGCWRSAEDEPAELGPLPP
jgi:hypothetical protein